MRSSDTPSFSIELSMVTSVLRSFLRRKRLFVDSSRKGYNSAMKVFLFFMCLLFLTYANPDFDPRPTPDFDKDHDLDDFVTEADDLGPPLDLENDHELKNVPDQKGIDPEMSLDHDDEFDLNEDDDGDDDDDDDDDNDNDDHDDDMKKGKATADDELEGLKHGGVSKSPVSNINPPARQIIMKVGHFYFNAAFFIYLFLLLN